MKKKKKFLVLSYFIRYVFIWLPCVNLSSSTSVYQTYNRRGEEGKNDLIYTKNHKQSIYNSKSSC